MKYIKLLIISFLIISCNNSKDLKQDATLEKDTFSEFTKIIDHYAEEKLQNGNANSFALAIYKNGEVYQNYYGEIDKDKNNKPTDSSLYEIASITKTFTGSLVAKAVLENKIALEDDIRIYLDGDYSNLEFQGIPITIKDLLTHSLGLKEKTPARLKAIRDKISNGTFDKEIDKYSIQDLLKELQTVEVNKKPGTVFVYNSVGPELLAYILEKVNNQSFNQQLEVFFKEIGMSNTYLQDFDHKKSLLVNGYRNDTIAKKNTSLLYGAAGAAVSTLPDLVIYMKYLIENKNELWVKEASRTLFVDQEDGEQIGYLWQNIGIGEEEGYFYSKTGTSNGVQSGILICPGTNYGIVLIVNNTSENAYNDWARLFFNQIEPDLIKYPKLNLFSSLKEKFVNDTESAFQEYSRLKNDTTTYFSNTGSLNNFGYQLLHDNKKQKAISVFKFITEEFPENANAYDSLGEAYFVIEDYDKALLNYKKSLDLNPGNNNARVYIDKIEKLRQE